jgi:acetyl-CoA C-acetyltransferase
MKHEAVIVNAVRTPIGSFNGSLKEVAAVALGATVIRSVLDRASLSPLLVDEVIMGHVLQAGTGQNPARQSALAAGLPQEVSAVTINKVCGSGLKAVQLAAQSIRCGDSDIIVAGGMENMSQAPYLLQGGRAGWRMGHQTMVDSMIHDGLWCSLGKHHMGITAENLVERYGLTREQLDSYAAESQRRAILAQATGRFSAEIVPVEVRARGGVAALIDEDEYPRRDTTVASLQKLRPAFKKEGAITAGNSSGINDGAAALLMMSAEKAERLGLKPLAVVRAIATAGVDPAVMGIGPVPAIRKALALAGLAESDIGLVEANEAFAAQAIASLSHFSFDPGIVNVNGGAIALGHPIGASGARIMVTLLHEMERRKVAFGLAALCIGGGQGIAAVVERVES